MTEERELAGFALPFASGILSAYLFLPVRNLGLNASIPVLACMIIIFLTSRRPHAGNKVITWSAIISLAFLTGMSCYQTREMMISEASGWSVSIQNITYSWCCRIRSAIASIPFENPETSAIINALLTGDKGDIPYEIKECFRVSGASHILALSGMHLGIIYGITAKMLTAAGNSEEAVTGRSIAIIAICGFYTLVVGAGESIVRSFLFILINETARITHRSRSLKQTLSCALVLQLALSPSSIASVGFQLSYAAMLGIAYIHPWLLRFWPGDGSGPNPFRKIWGMASMSISCQITTGPLAWYYFRSFPTHFLLANLLAIPMTGLIIPTSLLTVLLHSTDLCPNILIRFTELQISILTGSLTVIAGM